MTYIDRSLTTPRPIHVHVIQVDLATPGIRVMLTPPAGPRESIRQTTAAFVNSVHAQAGINAHFFLPFPSTDTSDWLIGLAASDGRVFSACESPEQSFAIVADAPAINIDATNHASIVHCDTSQPDGRHVKESVRLWTALAGSAQIVTEGVVTIPRYHDPAHPDGTLTPGSSSHYSGLERVEPRRRRVDVAGPCGSGHRRARLVNTSSDNPAGRAVGSSLAVFAQPTK